MRLLVAGWKPALRGQNTIIAAVLLAVGLATGAGVAALAVTQNPATALIAAAAAAATIGAIASIEVGILVIILVACTDGLLKGISPGWHTQLLKDYFLAICLLRWGWLSVLGQRRESMRHRVVTAALVFAAWCVTEMFNVQVRNQIMALAALRSWLIWIPLFVLTHDYLRTRKQVERLALFILVVLIPIGVYAIVQYNVGYEHLYRLGPGFRHYARFGYMTKEYQSEMRPASTMVQPHNLAAGMSCAILLGAGAIGYFYRRRPHQLLTIVGIGIFTAAMLITGGRTAVGGTAVGLLLLLLLTRGVRIAVVMAILFAVVGTQISGITQQRVITRLATIVTEREYVRYRIFHHVQNALEFSQTHFLGAGLYTTTGAGRLIRQAGVAQRTVEDLPGVENDFARAMMELGVPGFLIYMWMLYAAGSGAFSAYRQLKDPRDRWLAIGLMSACLGVVTRLLTGPSLYTWPEGIFFWVFLGVALRLPQIAAAEEEARLASETAAGSDRSVAR